MEERNKEEGGGRGNSRVLAVGWEKGRKRGKAVVYGGHQ